MTLSFNKLNEIAELYESIAASEQEQLNEGPIDVEKSAKLERGIANFFTGKPRLTPAEMRASTSGVPVPKSPAEKPKPASEAKPPSQQAKQAYAASKGKYFSSSDQKTYKSEADAKAARAGRLKDLAATQAAARAKNSSIDNSQSSRNPQPPASGNTRPPVNPKVAPTKPTGSAMDQWAKANPKLAAAKAERDRTRGTSATTNPLMKDMKSSLPAPAPKSAPPSSTLKSATDSASKPSAFKPATTAVASSTTDKGVVPATNAIAAKPKPVTPNPSATSTKPGDGKPYKDGPLWDSYQYDAYDLVLEYLLSQGHAETVAEAQYLMIEMDSEMIGEIVEGIADRTANAVGHQRAGTLGDADEMRKNQDATSASIGKMKRGSGAKVTPTLPGV